MHSKIRRDSVLAEVDVRKCARVWMRVRQAHGTLQLRLRTVEVSSEEVLKQEEPEHSCQEKTILGSE